MKSVVAPDGNCIPCPTGQILTFGISPEQRSTIQEHLPGRDDLCVSAETISDLIALPSYAVIIGAWELSIAEKKELEEYYRELSDCISETVFWIEPSETRSKLPKSIRCLSSFEEFEASLPYSLLQVRSKQKTADSFSRKMADCLMILSMIRQQPGITTKVLAERMELSVRTVQRYISTLQAAGEWIDYDRPSRGWKLQNGVSILFGDHNVPRR